MSLPAHSPKQQSFGPFSSWLHRILEREIETANSPYRVQGRHSFVDPGKTHADSDADTDRHPPAILDRCRRRKVRFYDQMVALPQISSGRGLFSGKNSF